MSNDLIQAQFLASIERGDVDGARRLIGMGADVNFRGADPDGETPLMRAVTSEQLEAVRLLLEAGAGANCSARINGWTALMFAHDKRSIALALVTLGADVNAQAKVFSLRSPVTGRLLQRGGETTLHLAAAANDVKVVRILAEAGAELEMLDGSGSAPLDVALRTGSLNEAAVVLVEAGAKLTPERLETMHSGAHGPSSTLRFFPSVEELELKCGPGLTEGVLVGELHRSRT